ncbi:MAG: hypothetical protein MMC33_005323 [Icmadophila ericetorum]|nr:hypothetical protein [Icmadophila ericetorum]
MPSPHQLLRATSKPLLDVTRTIRARIDADDKVTHAWVAPTGPAAMKRSDADEEVAHAWVPSGGGK